MSNRPTWLAPALSVACLAAPVTTSAQDVFASTRSATLPTAAPSSAGGVHIEISHRFGYLSDGAGALWGLDGFVLNPTQTLAGAADDFFDPDSWRFGFNIQRRLGF